MEGEMLLSKSLLANGGKEEKTRCFYEGEKQRSNEQEKKKDKE